MKTGTYNWKAALKVCMLWFLVDIPLDVVRESMASEVPQTTWIVTCLAAYFVIFLLRVMAPWALGMKPFFWGPAWELGILAIFSLTVVFAHPGEISEAGWAVYLLRSIASAAVVGAIAGASTTFQRRA